MNRLFLFDARPVHLVAVLLAALTAACGGEAQPQQQAGPPPPMPVQLLTLESAPVEQAEAFVATVKSRRSTTVQPQAEGILTRILVRSGTRVRPGTVMFEIDDTAEQAAAASLQSLRASREADASFARQQVERTKRLLDAGAISAQEFEQAQTQLQNAEAQLKSIEDQIRQQRAELAYFKVTATTPGVVGDIPVRQGERVTRATELTTIEDNAGLEVYVNVPVQSAPRLKIGLPIQLVDDSNQVLTTTRVSFIASSVDDATQTVLVKAPVDAGVGQFRADQFVRARIVWSTEPQLMLPIIAVQRIASQYFVFVAESADGGLVAKQRPVTVGQVIGNNYVVLSGIKAGERLVLAGTQKIGDGAPIQELPATPPAGSAPATNPATTPGTEKEGN
jgi:RND family efflux transporter MFP subunit